MDIQVYIQSGVIESYVLGMANAQEVAELQRLRLAYPEIEAAIEQSEKWLLDSSRDVAIPVSATIKETLLTTLQDEFTAPAPVVQASGRTVSMKTKYLVAASLILFMASAGVNVYLYRKYTKATSDYIALQNERNTMLANNKLYQARLTALYQNMQIISDTGMLKVSMPGIQGKENNLATLYWNTKNKNVYLIANNLPQAPAGKQYQLWALVDGKPVDAGVLENCEGLCQLKTVQQAQAFAITLEKAGGSPVPDLSQLYVMGKVQS